MYDAQNFAQKHASELGMKTVPSLDVVYTEEQGYVTADVVGATTGALCAFVQHAALASCMENCFACSSLLQKKLQVHAAFFSMYLLTHLPCRPRRRTCTSRS